MTGSVSEALGRASAMAARMAAVAPSTDGLVMCFASADMPKPMISAKMGALRAWAEARFRG